MKSNSNDRPPILQDLGNGSWHYNYDITEVDVQPEPMAEQEREQAPAARKAYDYDTVEVWGRPDYDKCVRPFCVPAGTKPKNLALSTSTTLSYLGFRRTKRTKPNTKTTLKKCLRLKQWFGPTLPPPVST